MIVYKVEKEWNCYGEGGRVIKLYSGKDKAVEMFKEQVEEAKEMYCFAFDSDGKPFDDFVFETTDNMWTVFEQGFYDENRCEVTLTPMEVK